MEESWENELRKYWCIIANETEALLKRECIKNHVQFNDGFKNDLLQTTNKRIAETYERFLVDMKEIREIGLRNGFITDANEQQNQNSPTILSDNAISSTEPSDTVTRQSNQCTVLDNTIETNQKSSSSSSILKNETSNPKESMIIQSHGQQAESTTHDESNVQHSTDSIPDTVSETSYISGHEQILADLNYIINQDASNENPSNQNIVSRAGLDHLENVLGNCFDEEDIESALKLVNDSTIFKNTEANETQEIKLEQDSANETTVTSTVTAGDNRNYGFDVQVIGSTDSHLPTIDLTLDSEVGPVDNPSVIGNPARNLNINANKSNTRVKKRKNVTFANDAEVPGKKQKLDAGSQLNFDASSTEQHGNLTMNNRADDTYKCAICAKEYSRNSKLEAHMKAHENDIMFNCAICNRKFSRSRENNWKSHVEGCKLKLFECYLCKKKMHLKINLLEHIRNHAGVKRFRCSKCAQRFVSKRAVLGHIKKDHKKGKQAVVNVKNATK